MSIIASLPHSFDTVVVWIPLKTGLEPSSLPDARAITNYNPDNSPKSEFLTKFLKSFDDFADAPSWWSPPRVTQDGLRLKYQFSLPKAFYGHSAVHAGADLLGQIS